MAAAPAFSGHHESAVADAVEDASVHAPGDPDRATGATEPTAKPTPKPSTPSRDNAHDPIRHTPRWYLLHTTNPAAGFTKDIEAPAARKTAGCAPRSSINVAEIVAYLGLSVSSEWIRISSCSLSGNDHDMTEGDILRNKKLGAAVVALATGAFVFGAGTTAQAANGSACRQQDKSFAIPGKPDISVTINLCVERNNGRHRAVADVSWGSWAGVPENSFDDFNVKVRLERYDRDQKTKSVNLTPYINDPGRYANHITIETAWSTSSATGGWTADGSVSYNINNDGKGDAAWPLHGSPQIR